MVARSKFVLGVFGCVSGDTLQKDESKVYPPWPHANKPDDVSCASNDASDCGGCTDKDENVGCYAMDRRFYGGKCAKTGKCILVDGCSFKEGAYTTGEELEVDQDLVPDARECYLLCDALDDECFSWVWYTADATGGQKCVLRSFDGYALRQTIPHTFSGLKSIAKCGEVKDKNCYESCEKPIEVCVEGDCVPAKFAYQVDGCPRLPEGKQLQDRLKPAGDDAAFDDKEAGLQGLLCCKTFSKGNTKVRCLQAENCRTSKVSHSFGSAARACDNFRTRRRKGGFRLCTKDELQSNICCKSRRFMRSCNNKHVWSSDTRQDNN